MSHPKIVFGLVLPVSGSVIISISVSIPAKNQTIKKLRRIRCIERLRRSLQ